MLKIRKEQMDAFLPQDDESIISFIIEHMQKEYYDYVSDMPISALREMVANGLSHARQYEFTELEDLVVFVTWMFIVAPNFDEQSELKEVLLNKTLPASQRIESMLGADFDLSWEKAHQNYKRDAWFSELQRKDEEQMEWQQH